LPNPSVACASPAKPAAHAVGGVVLGLSADGDADPRDLTGIGGPAAHDRDQPRIVAAHVERERPALLEVGLQADGDRIVIREADRVRVRGLVDELVDELLRLR
jgi:hypothetical protein